MHIIISYFGFLLTALTITSTLFIWNRVRLLPINLAGLFVTAYLQYRRGD